MIAEVVTVPSDCSQKCFAPAHSSSFIWTPITIPDGAPFSQQLLRACHTPPGSYGNPVLQTSLKCYK